MRSIPIGHIALLVLALSAFAQGARASERYMCADGSFVEVTSQNRAEQSQHPCVKAWFERRAERKKKPEKKTGEARPDASDAAGPGAVLRAAATPPAADDGANRR